MSKLPIRWTEHYNAQYKRLRVAGHLGQRTIYRELTTIADLVSRKEVSKAKVEIAKELSRLENV